ncbi:hypothetical protein MFUL124B02_11995 [Myxococcus fulvus 124B02]|nr:hypothetical protein MFUL124B02_11995 [Myxococcus fulvus 124B02]
MKTSSTRSSTRFASLCTSASAKSCTIVRSMAPSASATSSSVGFAPHEASTWSSRLSASRMPPSDWRTTSDNERSEMPAPSALQISCSRWSIRAAEMRRKLWRWQRDRMVSGSLCASVVAKMNFTCPGGSSSVLSSALNAAPDSMWTSSMM